MPWRRAATVALLALPALASLVAAPFTPYEMSSRELTAAVQRIRSAHPQAAILVPWNYTDYHFLALAFPDAPVYLVQSPVDTRGRIVRDEWWERKQRSIYGRAYIGNEEELAGLGTRPLFYLGHGRLPPLQNLTRLARGLRMGFVVRMIEAMHPLDHITQSWMWEHPRFDFEESFRSGRYTVYRVRHRTPAAGSAHGTRSRLLETEDPTLTGARTTAPHRLPEVEPASEWLS